MQVETGSPSTSAVQAPHMPMPQVARTLLRSSSRRSTSSSISLACASTSVGVPFTLKRIFTGDLLLFGQSIMLHLGALPRFVVDDRLRSALLPPTWVGR